MTSLYGAAAEYALHSLLTLASRNAPASVRDLAAYQRIPERFLAKVFTRLTKAGLVAASEGIAGGFVLARPPEAIRVVDILDAVDPDRTLFACGEIRRQCALYPKTPPGWAVTGPCRIHAFLQEAEARMRAFLATKTLADLVGELGAKAPKTFIEETGAWFDQQKRDRVGRRAKEKDGRPTGPEEA
jgi:Rrf2 family protein